MKDTADPEICLPEQEGFVLISKKRKGKILNRAAATAMTLCLLCALLGVSALALETTTVKIPVSQSADPKSASSTFTYELKANDSSAPMPAGAENGVATLELTGTDEGVFSIDFSEAGTYEYTITQKESSDSKLKHDTTQYTVEVQVLDDGEVQVAAYKPDSSGEKVDKAKEINFAAKTVTSTVTPTPTPTATPAPTPTPSEEPEPSESVEPTPTPTPTQTTLVTPTPSPTNPAKGQSGKAVKTGDTMRLGLLIGLAVVSLLAIIFLIRSGRKKEDKDE